MRGESPARWRPRGRQPGGWIDRYGSWLRSPGVRGRDPKDPLLSPIYGDVSGFPPAILTSGTRDLYLSNTVRMHRKLRAAGVEAILQVWEGQSHTQYMTDIAAPETKEYHNEVASFFDRHLR